MSTRIDYLMFIEQVSADHTHARETGIINANEAFSEMAASIQDDPTQTIRSVYEQVTVARQDEDPVNFDRVRSRLSRDRSLNMPPVPGTNICMFKKYPTQSTNLPNNNVDMTSYVNRFPLYIFPRGVHILSTWYLTPPTLFTLAFSNSNTVHVYFRYS